MSPGSIPCSQKNRERIETTTDLVYAVGKTELTFICVGTPPDKDGSSDLSQIREVSHTIGKALRTDTRFHTIITKSTVLPGTIENVIIPILEKESGKKAGTGFGIASNPEFLKEGTAVDDFFHTDRVVIGVNDQKTKELLEELVPAPECPDLYDHAADFRDDKIRKQCISRDKNQLCQ